MINVLYVDDEENNLLSFKANFRRYFTIYTASSAAEAKAILTTHTVHVIISDQKMPKTTGAQLLGESAKKHPHIPRILVTAYADSEAIISAINEGQICKYLRKPLDAILVKTSIEEAYKKYETLATVKKEVESLREKRRKLNLEIDEILKTKIGISKDQN